MINALRIMISVLAFHFIFTGGFIGTNVGVGAYVDASIKAIALVFLIDQLLPYWQKKIEEKFGVRWWTAPVKKLEEVYGGSWWTFK